MFIWGSRWLQERWSNLFSKCWVLVNFLSGRVTHFFKGGYAKILVGFPLRWVPQGLCRISKGNSGWVLTFCRVVVV